ncbi:hypothetical protein NHX12_033610, partial [Muraenolepis orangiensis]
MPRVETRVILVGEASRNAALVQALKRIFRSPQLNRSIFIAPYCVLKGRATAEGCGPSQVVAIGEPGG